MAMGNDAVGSYDPRRDRVLGSPAAAQAIPSGSLQANNRPEPPPGRMRMAIEQRQELNNILLELAQRLEHTADVFCGARPEDPKINKGAETSIAGNLIDTLEIMNMVQGSAIDRLRSALVRLENL